MVTMLMPNILLLEDEALIALDVERTLADAQIGQATSFASCAGALSWLETNTPDVAVVDIFLRDGECDEVAKILVARGVPLVIHSARRGAASDNHRVFLSGTWICKPSDPSELTRAVKTCLEKPARRRPATSDGENLQAGKRRACSLPA
jgi:DNA-binding response OmpR family regulator